MFSYGQRVPVKTRAEIAKMRVRVTLVIQHAHRKAGIEDPGTLRELVGAQRQDEQIIVALEQFNGEMLYDI